MAERTPLLQILREPPGSSRSVSPRESGERTPFGSVDWSAVADRMREIAMRPRLPATERCDMCGAAIGSEHGHVVNVAERGLLCVCRPCYLLFTHDGAGGARFRAVPQRYVTVAASPALQLPLDVPIGLAFFFRNSATGQATAFYPSPAGATESELEPGAWERLVRELPGAEPPRDDVEAVLARRGPDGLDVLIVPIDACYELVGLVRRSWRGFSGGTALWSAVDAFFARVRDRARPMPSGQMP